MTTQTQRDAAYYWSVCVLKRLQTLDLLTSEEVARVRALSQAHYGSRLIMS